MKPIVVCMLVLGVVSCSVGSAWFGDSPNAAVTGETRSGVDACLDAQAHQGFLGGLAERLRVLPQWRSLLEHDDRLPVR